MSTLTHDVSNQSAPFEDVNLFETDLVLQEARGRGGAGGGGGRARGARAGGGAAAAGAPPPPTTRDGRP